MHSSTTPMFKIRGHAVKLTQFFYNQSMTWLQTLRGMTITDHQYSQSLFKQ